MWELPMTEEIRERTEKFDFADRLIRGKYECSFLVDLPAGTMCERDSNTNKLKTSVYN